MTDTQAAPLTDEQLAEYEALIARTSPLGAATAAPGMAVALLADLRRARTELAAERERYMAGLRRADEMNNSLMEEVQRYADGTEHPVLWSVYNAMHKRALTAEARVAELEQQAAAPAVDRAALRDRIADALERADYRPDMRRGDLADAIMPVLPPTVSRAALIAATARACAEHIRERYSDRWTADAADSLDLNAARIERSEPTALLRRLADETPGGEALPDEDPARIDRLRPEFTEHSSVEAIDAQLHRARSQQRRWHLRTEWLISLRQARIAQKENGEQRAAERQDGATP